MPVISPYRVALTAGEQSVLMARARSARGPHRDRLRAQIVLAAAAGSTNMAIATQVGVHVDTVRKWRRRFAAAGLAGLKDAPRSGRPPVFTAADRAEAVALACALPAESGVPLARWSCPDLARELAARRQIAASASTIGRWLAADALLASLFTPDGAVRIPHVNAESAGREEIRAGIERQQALLDYFVQTTHPGTIRLDGNTASGRAYLCELGRFRDGRSQLNYAIYHDRYQRTGEGWK